MTRSRCSRARSFLAVRYVSLPEQKICDGCDEDDGDDDDCDDVDGEQRR